MNRIDLILLTQAFASPTDMASPDEAMSVGLAKACVRRIKSILFIEKSNALNNIKQNEKPTFYTHSCFKGGIISWNWIPAQGSG